MNCLSSSNVPSYAAAAFKIRSRQVISRRRSYLNGSSIPTSISYGASESNFATAAACTTGVVKLQLATEDNVYCCYSSSKRRSSKMTSYASGAFPRKSRGGGNSGHLQLNEDDEDEDEDENDSEDYEDEDEDLDEDEDEEGEMVLPLEKMKEWLQNKPRGFGIGKVYDTSIEEKLLEEISVSQIAQAANINKLKSNPDKPPISKKLQTNTQQKASEVSTGVRVRILNLPKKKNVHRDLKVAFTGVPGLIRIVPAVLGNSKTRDPICKGFAFVEFKTDKDAIRFVQTFSNQTVAFGKVQKEIKCEMINLKPSISIKESSVVNGINAAPQAAITLDMELESSPDSSEENDLEQTREVEDDAMNRVKSSAAVGKHSIKRTEEATKSSGEVDKQKPKEVQKKKKKKVPNYPVKLMVPGSAKRLQVKEKAMLSGVFSKYGANAAAKET